MLKHHLMMCNDAIKIKTYGAVGVSLGLGGEIDVSNPTLEISHRLVGSKTLKEFVEGCGWEIKKLFIFNKNY